MHHTSYSTSVTFFRTRQKNANITPNKLAWEWDCTCKG